MITANLPVKEIRRILIEEHNLDKDIVNNMKGKEQLTNLLSSVANNLTEDIFEDKPLNQPSKLDPTWTKYVLDQLADDEYDKDKNNPDKKYPKTAGLGRLVEVLIAGIESLKTTVVQPPNIENNMTATVKTTLCLENGQCFEAIADACKAELPPPYDKYISAIADTRSEGRAYRRALRLKNVVTQEEIAGQNIPQTEDKINENQVRLLETLCGRTRLNINIDKLLKSIFKDKVKNNIYQYSHTDGATIISLLNDYQSDNSKIPGEIKGFEITSNSKLDF